MFALEAPYSTYEDTLTIKDRVEVIADVERILEDGQRVGHGGLSTTLEDKRARGRSEDT